MKQKEKLALIDKLIAAQKELRETEKKYKTLLYEQVERKGKIEKRIDEILAKLESSS